MLLNVIVDSSLSSVSLLLNETGCFYFVLPQRGMKRVL